jgi:hypothetical protein
MSAATLPARLPYRGHSAGDGIEASPARPTGADPGPRDVEDLCTQFVLVCESAVDPLEICCVLEFDGWNDKAVSDRYGMPDVFTLAEEMYRRVPRRPAGPELPPDPWQASKAKAALHGLLYGLPTACFPAAAGLLTGPGVLSVLIVVSLTSWAISQFLAYLGYLRLGQAGPVLAARLLLAGLFAGLAGVLLALAVAGLALPVRTAVVIFAAGFGAYMLGATVLITLGAERLLLAAAAPGVLGALAFLLLGRPPQLADPAWIALAATPLLALALAAASATRTAGLVHRSRGRHARAGSTPTGQGGSQLISAAELRGALPSAGFGLLAAGLFAFPVTVETPGRPGAALLVSLPLAMSMGAAEWMLIWFRRRTQRLLRSTRELRVFAIRAQITLLAALLQYLAITAILTAAVAAIGAMTRLADPQMASLPQVVAYLALAGAMFTALLLQAFGSRAIPLAGCAMALAAEVASRASGVSAQVVTCTELLLALTGYAAIVLGSATRHAC